MFTSQHYKIIAKVIKESSQGTPLIDKGKLVSLLSFYFSTDNLSFNETKFKDACN